MWQSQSVKPPNSWLNAIAHRPRRKPNLQSSFFNFSFNFISLSNPTNTSSPPSAPLALYCVAFINSIPKTKLRATSPLTLTQFGSLLLLALRICCFFLFCYFLSLCLCFAVSVAVSLSLFDQHCWPSARCCALALAGQPNVGHNGHRWGYWRWLGIVAGLGMRRHNARTHNTILCNADGLWHWVHSHIIYGSRRVHLSQFCHQPERSF